jgi:hypothetical protein
MSADISSPSLLLRKKPESASMFSFSTNSGSTWHNIKSEMKGKSWDDQVSLMNGFVTLAYGAVDMDLERMPLLLTKIPTNLPSSALADARKYSDYLEWE